MVCVCVFSLLPSLSPVLTHLKHTFFKTLYLVRSRTHAHTYTQTHPPIGPHTEKKAYCTHTHPFTLFSFSDHMNSVPKMNISCSSSSDRRAQPPLGVMTDWLDGRGGGFAQVTRTVIRLIGPISWLPSPRVCHLLSTILPCQHNQTSRRASPSYQERINK